MTEHENNSKANERGSREIIGMPVYSIDEGLLMGTVRSLMLDTKNQVVQGFIIERRKFSRDERILPFSNVAFFGDDTITIQTKSQLEPKGARHQFARSIRQPISLIGSRVFTADGHIMGKIEEYRFRLTDGRIWGLEIAGEGIFQEKLLLRGEYIIAISPNTVMLKAEALNAAVPMENSLFTSMGEAAQTMKEKTAQIKNGAIEATKKISESLTGVMDKFRERELVPDEMQPDLFIEGKEEKGTPALDIIEEASQQETDKENTDKK